MFSNNGIRNIKSISSLVAVASLSVVAFTGLSASADASCLKGIQIQPVAPQAQSDGIWASKDQQSAIAKVTVCDLSSAPTVQLMKYTGTWSKVKDLAATRSTDGSYSVNTGALSGSEEGTTYRIVASADQDYSALKGIQVIKDAPTVGGGDRDPDPVPPVVVPNQDVPANQPAPPAFRAPVTADQPKQDAPKIAKTCKGKITSLYWQRERRKAARGKIKIKGSTAHVAKSWRAVYRGVVKGCKPGTILNVNALTSKGKVEKTGLKVRAGGKFTGMTEMNATDRTVVVKGKNSKKLYFDRLGS